MSYGADIKESFERAAELTVTSAQNPAWHLLPGMSRLIRVLCAYEVANTTGISLPNDFLALADEVIE